MTSEPISSRFDRTHETHTMFNAIYFRSATAKSTAPIPSDLSDKQAERERIERDIRSFLRRGGRIERLTADAISDSPNPHGYNDTSREKALRAARRGGATQRR